MNTIDGGGRFVADLTGSIIIGNLGKKKQLCSTSPLVVSTHILIITYLFIYE